MSELQMQDKGNRNQRNETLSLCLDFNVHHLEICVSCILIDQTPVCVLTSFPFEVQDMIWLHFLTNCCWDKMTPKRMSPHDATVNNLPYYASDGFSHAIYSMCAYAVCGIWAFIFAWHSNLFIKVRVDVCVRSESMPVPRLCAVLFLPHVSFYQPLDK